MPFLTLNNNWSNLAKYYNQSFNNKPEVPTLKYTAFDDGLIRGGVINATLASVRDTARVGKFFTSGKGALFITKQVGLQRSNPELEQETLTSEEFLKLSKTEQVSRLVGNTLKVSPNRIYNLGLNTLAQIPLTSIGGHIIRQGLLPIGGGGYLNNDSSNVKGYSYEKAVKKNNALSVVKTNSITKTNNTSTTNSTTNSTSFSPIGIDNRNTGTFFSTSGDVVLYSSPQDAAAGRVSRLAQQQTLNDVTITGRLSTPLTYQDLPNRLLQHLTSILTEDGKITNIKKSSSILLEYNGGPDSTYGLGKTIISTNKEQRTNVSNQPDDPKYEVLNGFKVKSYSVLDKLSQERSSTVQRQKQTYIAPFEEKNVEDRIGVSKIGGDKNLTKTVDSINVINIIDANTFYKGLSNNEGKPGTLPNTDAKVYSSNAIDSSLNGKVQGSFGRDIIKFRLEFLNNDTNIPTVLAFRAYIDDFNDGMTARWNSYRYMGRGEDFYIYDGFTRDISVAFTIYAHSPEEMKPLYQKLNYLMSTFAPDYSAANKMRGNIGYLTVGDYIYRQPGVFTDIKLSGMLDTHWEIALNDPEGDINDSKQYEVPKHIKINLSFKPIHDFLPRRATAYTLDKSPFITPNSALINKEIKNKYLYNPAPTSS